MIFGMFSVILQENTEDQPPTVQKFLSRSEGSPDEATDEGSAGQTRVRLTGGRGRQGTSLLQGKDKNTLYV